MGRPIGRRTKLMRLDTDVCDALSYLGKRHRKPAKQVAREIVLNEGFALDDLAEGVKVGLSLGFYKPKKVNRNI